MTTPSWPPQTSGHGGWQGTDWYASGVIPPDLSLTIMQEVAQTSAALRLGNRIPMGTLVNEWPIPQTFPKAGWVNAPGGRKPFTDLSLTTQSMKAEEVAAVIAIPDVMRDDSSINLWNYARPLLSEAIALALDDAVFFGEDAPPSFPVGGLAAFAQNVPAGLDMIDTINQAMGAVELSGLNPTGHAADISVRAALRGVRDQNGDLILGFTEQDRYQIPSLFGLPIAYTQFTQTTPDYFVGDWRYLFIGVRQDIRFDMNPAGVIADDQGKVVISGWQDNTTPMKVWARFACAFVKPVTPRAPNGAIPFACSELVGADRSALSAGAPGSGGDGGDNGDVGPLSASTRRSTTTSKAKG